MQLYPYPVLQGIAIPVDFERFISPDLEQAMEYYPYYLRHGGTWKIQPYLCEIVRQFAVYESKSGRAESWGGFEAAKDEVLKQFFRHVGIARVMADFKECALLHKEWVESRQKGVS